MKFELDVNDEMIERMVIASLRGQYWDLMDDISSLKSKEVLADFQDADLEYDLKMVKHLKKVLMHNGVEPGPNPNHARGLDDETK